MQHILILYFLSSCQYTFCAQDFRNAKQEFGFKSFVAHSVLHICVIHLEYQYLSGVNVSLNTRTISKFFRLFPHRKPKYSWALRLKTYDQLTLLHFQRNSNGKQYEVITDKIKTSPVTVGTRQALHSFKERACRLLVTRDTPVMLGTEAYRTFQESQWGLNFIL